MNTSTRIGKITTSITMNRNLLTRVRELAISEKRTLSQQLELLLERHLASTTEPASKANRIGGRK